ncbi:hypothetical protein ABBQ38_005952 [Trebouxia sp. C0009 RCD-2024]
MRTARHKSSLCAHFAQTPFMELASQLLTAPRDCVKHQESSIPLLDLPDGLLEAISMCLPPASVCVLQSSCRHLKGLLQNDRLWQETLKGYDPVWVASGVCPVANRLGSNSWKELVATSASLQPAGIGGDVLVSPQAVCRKGLELWNSGEEWEKVVVQLDYHLCHTEHKSSRWRHALGDHHFRAENISDLVELIYFLWFEARQLCRAAIMLTKVLALLHQDRASAEPEAAEKWMGYSTMHVAIYAACAASYLLDLLHMQHFTSSPMSAQEPDIFLKACQGEDCLPGAATTPDDQFEWCGGRYSSTDLADAVAAVQVAYHEPQGTRGSSNRDSQPSDTSSPHNTEQGYPGQESEAASEAQCNLIHTLLSPDAWRVLGREAQALLTGLKSADHIPWAYLERWGSVLKQRVHRICCSSRGSCLAASDACRGYTLYAANTLLNRLHGGPERSSMYALTGRLYDSAKQYRRAAHYYKLQIMSNAGGSHTPNEVAALMCLAAAYDWDSLVTGAVRSCQHAFAWQRALVRCLLNHGAEQAVLCEQCQVLADMLSSGSSSRYAPHLHINTRLVLAVGAYQTSMSSQEGGPAVLVWLQGQLEVLQLAEQAFLIFLEDEQEAFNVITQHAERRRALRNESRNSRTGSSSRLDTSKSSIYNAHQQPPIILTPEHKELVERLGSAMSRLPGGDGGHRLSAIAMQGMDPAG